MAHLEPRPGRRVTRRLEAPRGYATAARFPGSLAAALADAHNGAVRRYGSDCGGFHAFDPQTKASAGVWDAGPPGFPHGTVVTPLAWGRIDAWMAQRALEADGIKEG